MDDPTTAGTGVDPKVLERIRALLAKAEATSFPAEAEAFTAKAQHMLSEHSIDIAMLEGDVHTSSPEHLVIVMDAPYASQKASLLSAIATPNGCRSVWSRASSTSTVFGFEHDLAAVDVLFTSLLVQADTELLMAERAGGSAPSRVRSFRASFYLGFASRIGQRLAEVWSEVAASAADARGAAVLPVLASRDQLVEHAMHDTFPHLSSRRVSLSNGSGFRAGRVAADKAELGRVGSRLRRAG